MSVGPGWAFVQGGFGCLLLFVLVGVLVAVGGGQAHADVGGLALLFVIGGLIGLVVLWIYRRGVRAGRRDRE